MRSNIALGVPGRPGRMRDDAALRVLAREI
jgi:hypothetical protein